MPESDLQTARELIEKLCNGALTPVESDSLGKILEECEEALDLYVRMMHLHHSLEYTVNVNGEDVFVEETDKLSAAMLRALDGLGASKDHSRDAGDCGPRTMIAPLQASLSGAASITKPTGVANRSVISRHRYSRWDIPPAVIASILLVAAIGVFSGLRTSQNETPHEEGVADVLPAIASNSAQVVWTSLDCNLASANSDVLEGTFLTDGQSIRIEKGEIKLHFKLGARVTLWGPSTFVVKSINAGILKSGNLTAEVAEDARGFTVDVPNGKVVDLGTKFGVVVDDFGVAKVGVFDGEVITYQNQRQGKERKVESLTMGHGLQWDSIESKRFLIDRPSLPLSNPAEESLFESRLSNLRPALADDFNDNNLDFDKWSILGSVEEKNGSLQLGGDTATSGNRGNVPYLLTKRQYDPSRGTIVITGNLIFRVPLDSNSGALSILTRAADRRGTFPRADYSYLATGVRSTFWPLNNEHGETLRILVRPSSDSVNVGLLGEDFSASRDSSEWIFQLVDDGINLSLTVIQKDDPEVRKTVSCRSLFKGSSNFIAIEGDPIASIRIDNLRIFQLEDYSWPSSQ